VVFTVGDGPHRVLALHGWFGSAHAWGWLPDLIDGRRFTYAFPDYRGYGDRRDAGGEFSIAEVGSDALAVVNDLGWDHFSLIGHSMGGMAASESSPTHPAG
jgi:pimeloyl-ACP methyl ester carboxylesterase